MKFPVKVAATVCAIVALAAGCNSSLLRPPAIIFADSGEFAVRTSIREEGARFPSVFTAFVPSVVPLHAGDALNFQLQDTGEPHTVAMGTLVDAAVEAVDGLGPTATLKQVEALKQMKRVPSVLPTKLESDVPRLNPSAAQRCFLDEGAPEVSAVGKGEACPEADQPDFDGRQAFFSSGIIREGEPFRAKLDADIEPGAYRFMCLVHRSSMTGTVEVRPSDVERPPVAELRTQSETEQNEIAGSLEPAARSVGVQAFDRAPKGPVWAGAGPRGITRGFVAAFIGRDVTVGNGEVLKWNVHRTHSISFNPSRKAKDGFVLEEGDGFVINPDAWKAVGSKPPPAAVFATPPADNKGITVNGGTWDGEGEWSSGVIRATPPRPVAYEMRFSEPGRYSYSCLVHPFMRGTVTVE